MELVLAIALAAATGLLVSRVGSRLPEGFFGGVTRLVGGFRLDGWPRGVQEEDPDRPWGRVSRLAARGSLPSVPKPTLTRVRPTVHPR